MRKDEALRKRLEEEKRQQQAAKQSWSSWLWGSSSKSTEQIDVFKGEMTDEQRKQLYSVLDYDEKEALAHTLSAPRDSLKARIAAKLRTGSFALRTNPHDSKDILSVVFETFRANIMQRPDSLEASLSLQAFKVFDGTTSDTLYPQIVRVKSSMQSQEQSESNEEPFFSVIYENKPLDGRADNALTLRMRHMEIIYHRGYVEAVYKFFKPPPSQLESVEALLVRRLPFHLAIY